MTDYNNENSGVLFKNDKEGNEARPDYTGKINVGGVEKRLAAWLKDGAKGKFLSLRVSDFEAKTAPVAADNFDDEIPF